MFSKRCIRDEDGNIICSDEYLFPENPEDYIKNDWCKDLEQLYIEILKENTKYYNDYIKGKF